MKLKQIYEFCSENVMNLPQPSCPAVRATRPAGALGRLRATRRPSFGSATIYL